jgi:pentalenene oxygenase
MSTTFSTGSAPGRLPLVGHVLPLMRRPVEFLGSLGRYGDLVEIRLGPTRAYVPCHQDLLRQVLTEDRTFDKGGPLFDRAKAIVGNGLGSCPHQDHRRQRRLVQPAFHRARMEQYATVMEDQISALVDSWQDGQTIDAFPVFYDLALRISLRTLFAGYTGTIDFDRFRKSFSTVLHHIVAQMFLPEAWKHVPTRANRRFREAMEYLDLTVSRIITEYRQSGVDHGDLMSILVAPPEDGEGSGLTDLEVRDQVISLLLAASETVPACLAWALYLLDLHPEVARRLREETDAVLRGRAARWDDVADLPYTAQVLTETLRLYPPGWFFTRITTKAVELAGTHLPAGTTVIFSPPTVHRRDDSYANPEKFDPDRWIGGQVPRQRREAFTPFGGGARKCVGDNYAMVEMTMALATVVQQWGAVCAPGTDTRPAPLATINYPRRLLLRLTRRTPEPALAPAALTGDSRGY